MDPSGVQIPNPKSKLKQHIEPSRDLNEFYPDTLFSPHLFPSPKSALELNSICNKGNEFAVEFCGMDP